MCRARAAYVANVVLDMVGLALSFATDSSFESSGGPRPSCNLSGWWSDNTKILQRGTNVVSAAGYGNGAGVFDTDRFQLVMNFSNYYMGSLVGNVSTDCNVVSWTTGVWRRLPPPPPHLKVFPRCTSTGPVYQPGIAALPADCPLDVSPGASLRFTGELACFTHISRESPPRDLAEEGPTTLC